MLHAKPLSETHRVTVVPFALRDKTRLTALRVKEFGKRDVTVVQTLSRPDDIRDADFPLPDRWWNR